MKNGRLNALSAPLATLLLTAVVSGCGDAGGETTSARPVDAPVAVPTADATAETTTPAADSAAKVTAPDACDLLTIAEIKKLTGLAVSIRTNTPDRCIWIVEKPTDSHYGGLTIGVQAYATAEEAKEQFKWFVSERVPGIGDEASVRESGVTELAVRVGAAKLTITEQNPAITQEVLFELGRSVARNAG
ncbi:hypothetical protein [Actinoplanes sp. NPDC049118]|uniref:hypothetical protein n=1 Tax=Actinoplanes sp. NPDC049118 TaxID=3155769 RepID=UPI0033D01694